MSCCPLFFYQNKNKLNVAISQVVRCGLLLSLMTPVWAFAETQAQSKSHTLQQTVQQQLQSSDKLQPLSFDDLEHYSIDSVDPAMLSEIYQVAEQAKQVAEDWQHHQSHATALNQPDVSVIPSLMDTIDEEPIETTAVSVPALMQQIQQNRSDMLAQWQGEEDLSSTSLPSSEVSGEHEHAEKGWYAAWKEKRQQFDLGKIDYIDVVVEGVADSALKENIVAKLSAISVEAFQDFQYLLPQLNALSTQAAQAVGYYDVKFRFKALDGDTLSVQVQSQPNPVFVQQQEIEFSGAGEYLPQFQIVKLIPDLEIGQVLHHGLYTQTKDRINEASQNNGFFDSYWREHDVQVRLPEKTAEISLKFETGERYKLGDVEFRMSDDRPLPLNEQVLRQLIPWKEGDDYTAWRVNLLSSHLTNSRYFNSVTVNVAKPDPLEKQAEQPADVVATLAKEQQAQSVEFTAPNSTALLSASDESKFVGVDNTARERSSGGLTQEEVLAHKIDDLQLQARQEKKVPVVVTLNADTLNSLETGLGYGTDTGVRIRSQYRRAIVNRYGHSLLANMEASKVRKALDMRYSIPYPHAINQYVNLVAGYEREDNFNVGQGLQFFTQSAVLGGDYVIKTNRFDSWKHELGLRYRLDKITLKGHVDPMTIPDEFVAVKGQDTQQSLLFSYSTSKIYADSAMYPTRGFKHHYKVEAGSRSLLSDVNIGIVSAGINFIYSVGQNDNHQFIGRADGSYMFTEDFSKVPYNLRFFTGGDQSIRGFDYKSLSPTDNGFKVGGQALAIGSLEYNYQVKEGWRVGIFSDFGNSFDKKFSNPLAYSAGLGVRWKSPVGMIRADVATGLSDSRHPVRLHFFIGPQF